MKLEVGMYIRTDEGFIAKVKELKHDYTKGKRLVDDYSVKEVVENYLSLDGNQCRLIESIDYSIPPCYPSDEELDEIKSHILKASYNIIDILEVGDVIIDKEGRKYPINYEFETDYNDEYKSYEITIDDYITLFLKDGLSIVTHEQIEQISYKIEE